jgi:hypothetical protein
MKEPHIEYVEVSDWLNTYISSYLNNYPRCSYALSSLIGGILILAKFLAISMFLRALVGNLVYFELSALYKGEFISYSEYSKVLTSMLFILLMTAGSFLRIIQQDNKKSYTYTLMICYLIPDASELRHYKLKEEIIFNTIELTILTSLPLIIIFVIDCVKEDAAKTFKTLKFIWNNEEILIPIEDDCAICLEKLTTATDEYNRSIRTTCDHYFHKKCFKNIGDSSLIKTCPMCRQECNELLYNYNWDNSVFESNMGEVYSKSKKIQERLNNWKLSVCASLAFIGFKFLILSTAIKFIYSSICYAFLITLYPDNVLPYRLHISACIISSLAILLLVSIPGLDKSTRFMSWIAFNIFAFGDIIGLSILYYNILHLDSGNVFLIMMIIYLIMMGILTILLCIGLCVNCRSDNTTRRSESSDESEVYDRIL